MEIYSIEVANIYDGDKEFTEYYDSLEDAYYEAADIAEEMHKRLIDRYAHLPNYDREAFSIDDDIIYTEKARDAYEYYNHYE